MTNVLFASILDEDWNMPETCKDYASVRRSVNCRGGDHAIGQHAASCYHRSTEKRQCRCSNCLVDLHAMSSFSKLPRWPALPRFALQTIERKEYQMSLRMLCYVAKFESTASSLTNISCWETCSFTWTWNQTTKHRDYKRITIHDYTRNSWRVTNT